MNLRDYFLLLLLLFLRFTCYSQGEWNNWYFGNKAGLSFNSGVPLPVLNSTVSTNPCTVSISDSTGNFLFMSEGSRVWDRNFNLMPNGSGLMCSNGTHQVVNSFPFIEDDSTYYIFCVDQMDWPFTVQTCGLGYSILNMRLNNTFGDIVPTLKNIPVPGAFYASGGITTTRHQNNKDIWLAVRLHSTANHFAVYKISTTGLDTIPVLSNSLGHTDSTHTSDIIVWLKFSQDGSKFVCLYGKFGEFCQFNRQTGKITPLFKFSPNIGVPPLLCNGAEFSPNENFLYIVTTNNSATRYLYQFDATKTDSAQFMQSEVLLDSMNYGYFSLTLGPDFNIYGSEYGVDSLAMITSPNNQFPGCGFQRGSVPLLGRNCFYGLPQFLQKYKAYIHYVGSCQNSSILFSGDIWPPADSVLWNFGDPGSGSLNISSQANGRHTYSSPGSYPVELYVRHIDNRTDTSWQTINILSSPQVNLGGNRTICAGDSTTFNAGACTGCTYQWKNLGTGLIVGTGQTYKTGLADSYSVTVTNSNNCSGSDTIQLFTTPVPSVTNNPLSESICSGNSTNISLTSSVPGSIFHWTASLTSGNITGFSVDSGLVINQVLTDNLATPGIVTYHITPKVGSCTGSTVDYQVTVTPGAVVSVSVSASQNNVCAGTSITYTATPTNGGANPAYQWKVNGVNTGTGSDTYTYTPANNDIVTCVLTSSLSSCISNNPATSNAITMAINPLQPVSVIVAPSQNPVCAGSSVTYTATPTNGGANPSYQWKVNGTGVGTNSATYTYTPLNGDIVSCVLTSNATCSTGNPATSNPITITVNPNLAVSNSISASSNPFCLGSSVTFTATPTNGGALHSYQWKVNGVISGTNSNTFTYTPINNDVVTCDLNSSISCPISNPVTSNSITMVENTGLPAGVSISASANPFCPGALVTFTATPTNGGASPAYQWKVNGVNAGTNSSTYSYHPNTGDSVRCVITSNLSCVTNNPASSVDIIMSGTLAPQVSFTSCFDTVTTLNAKPIKLKGGIPLGGTYSGPGVNSLTGIFTPSVAGTGTKTIVYTYTNAALCSANQNLHIIVQSAPVFSCGNALTDIRDNKTYPTVQIGSQCWMAANLNYGTVLVSTQDQRDNCLFEKYCFNDNPANCTNLGALYQWDELMQYDNTPAVQGFCPPGWHIPSENDWNILFANYINNGFAGNPLKYSGYSGFNALLSGENYFNQSWKYQGFATFFWSSTSHSPTQAWAHGMNDEDPSVSAYPAGRGNAFSVRCVHD
jgi:uncharacterized protein (TIGR02145 family)